MRCIQVTIHVATFDNQDLTTDAVREVIHRAVSDGLGAEVCYTSGARTWDAPIPDPSDRDYDGWQETAYDVLERGPKGDNNV